jgi:hypothetical protein
LKAEKKKRDELNIKEYIPSEKHQKLLIEAICLNSIGTVDESSASERAMLQFMERYGVDIEKVRKEHLPKDFIRF